MERQVQLEQVISSAIGGLKASMYVSFPAAIVSYDPVSQTASVLPMTNDPRKDLTTGAVIFEPWGVLQNVPVMWPRCGGFCITGFLQPNDQVVIEAFDLDPTAWRQQGRSQIPTNPGDLGRFSGAHWRVNPCDLTLSSPGHGPNLSAPTAPGLVIGLDNGQTLIEIDGTNIKLGHNATDFVALASKVSAELTKIATAFSTFIPGSGGASFPHPYVSPSPVAATIAKAK